MIEINKLNKKPSEKKLMTNFNKALNDKDFKDFVDILGLSYEELSKYTSILEESKVEYYNCQNCKSILECKNKVTGYAYLPKIKNNDITFCYKKCRFKQTLDDKNKYLDNVYTFDVPEEIRMADVKEIDKKDKNRYDTIKFIGSFMKDYLNNNNPKGLYLHGNFGCGKTYLISAMFNELAKKNVKSAIIFWPEFLRMIKASFNEKDEFKIIYNKVKQAPILLIDDIGAENITAWSRDEILCPILQYRMEEHLPTFMTSNLNMDELETHLKTPDNSLVKAKRIIERVKQLMIEQEMISKNLRH